MIRQFALAFLLTLIASTAHADSVATLGGIAGDVKINQGVEFVQALPGQAVNAGDRILVMEGGSTSITFSDGCVLQISGGSLLTVPPTSTCKGAQARSQRIAPSDSGAVGEGAGAASGDYSTVNAVGWTWMGVVVACFVFCERDHHTENPIVTVSP